MSRVTTKMLYNNFSINIAKNFKNLEKATNEISSGKKLVKPSDDPNGIGKALAFKSKLTSLDSLRSNISHATSWMNTAESALSSISSVINNISTLANQYSGGVADTALVVEDLSGAIDDVISKGNSSFNNRYIFAGYKTSSPPFSSSLTYSGDGNDIDMEIDFNLKQTINIAGSEFIAQDMNPDITSSTTLSSLNKGNGVSAGSISITDRAGNTTTVNLSGASNISAVLSSISNASGVNVTATINTAGDGIDITDDNTTITGMLTISESGGGSTASDLGIFATRYGNIEGKNLDPSISLTTTVAELYSGSGMTFEDILVTNSSAASGAISFSSISSGSTISDVISIFNSSAFNITATINSNGTGLTVTSNDSSSVAIISESGNGTTASKLGIGGKSNILSTLNSLKSAFQIGDRVAISAAIDNLDVQLDNISRLRGGVFGGRLKRLETASFVHDKTEVDTISFLSDIEDTDIEKSAIELTSYQNAYQVSLASIGRISNTTLLDFLR